MPRLRSSPQFEALEFTPAISIFTTIGYPLHRAAVRRFMHSNEDFGLAYEQGGRLPERARTKGEFDLVVKRASAGLGLFANEPIPKGVRVIEYVGNLLTEEEYQKSRSSYLFDIGPKGALDGSPRWNLARYINHSCKPNCTTTTRGRRVFINSLRAIKPGEELSYDYGADYFDAYIAEYCRCIACTARKARKRK